MNLLSIIKKPIVEEFDNFNRYYQEQFDSTISLLKESLDYVSHSSGKQMRPLLLMLVAKSLGRISNETYAAATSLELLHLASLLHDDVIDESDMRRGVKSLNSLYSNRVAILSGDYLFSTSLYNASLTKNIEIIEMLSKMGKALSGGEILQLEQQYKLNYSEERYYKVIESKTASLFKCCAAFGALSVGADRKAVDSFARFGELLGCCFQIVDDIFDYYDNNVGKPTGSDMREGKITLPALYVLNNSANCSVVAIKEKLSSGKYLDEEDINLLIEVAKTEGGVEYARRKIEELRSAALSCLPSEIPNDCKEALEAYMQYVVSRNK